jgi:hypothetical protein
MKGSAIKNIKFNPEKQKLIQCEVCGDSIIVGKFAKVNQKCEECKKISKKKKAEKQEKLKLVEDESTFAKRLTRMAIELGFDITDKRLWRKRYAIDGGGIATIHIMIEPNITGKEPSVGYFSFVVQRAIGVNENFRKFMPPDAASDCEMIAIEFGKQNIYKPQVGQEKCAKCGSMTDEFGVDNKNNRILCIKPNNCFKQYFTTAGAESEE